MNRLQFLRSLGLFPLALKPKPEHKEITVKLSIDGRQIAQAIIDGKLLPNEVIRKVGSGLGSIFLHKSGAWSLARPDGVRP